MEFLVSMVRHGATRGNLERRYVGTTDEGLLAESAQALKKARFSQVDAVFYSPMRRCLETAEALFPEGTYTAVEEFRECDFGAFEYRKYEELKDTPEYRRFLETLGQSGFPEGESREEFQARCVRGFERSLGEAAESFGEALRGPQEPVRVALVVHGGTIMAILDAFSQPHRDYYEWQTGNGEGFVMRCLFENGKVLGCFSIRPISSDGRIG